MYALAIATLAFLLLTAYAVYLVRAYLLYLAITPGRIGLLICAYCFCYVPFAGSLYPKYHTSEQYGGYFSTLLGGSYPRHLLPVASPGGQSREQEKRQG